MKRTVVTIVAAAALAAALIVPRSARWTAAAMLPLFPSQRATVDSCGTPDASLLRKLVARSESVSCMPDWWVVPVDDDREELGAWFAARSTDPTLRVEDRWHAALVTQSLDVEPPPIVWTRAAARRHHDRTARAVLWDARQRFGDALDPASAVAADLSRWVAEDLPPADPLRALRWAARGWAEESGLGHVARAYARTGTVEDSGGSSVPSSITRRAYGSPAPPTLQEACERAESPSCLAAIVDHLEDAPWSGAELPPFVRSWTSVTGTDEHEVADLMEAWTRWAAGRPDDELGAVLLERMDRAVGLVDAAPLSLDPSAPASPWTSALAIVWLSRAVDMAPEVFRHADGLEIRLGDDVRRRGDCGRPKTASTEELVVVDDRELLARASWEYAQVHGDEVVEAFARRLGGGPSPVGDSVGAKLAAMIRPQGDAAPLTWQACAP